MGRSLCITSAPEDLVEGLFGQTFYYLLQVLPYLYREKIFPQWEVRTKHYGDAPDFLTVPGVLDLAYEPPKGPYRRIDLWEFRRRHAHVLGSDWKGLNQLWQTYFKLPERISSSANEVLPQGRLLGIHYRGTDKQTASWDSNPISQDEYFSLIQDFLGQRPGFDTIFAATDESGFVERLRRVSPLPVVSLGEVTHHLAEITESTRAAKADRAMLDCVLLSRCLCVLETSSALPSFAKLLNPDLEIYRCAASKLFGVRYTNMPYFPVAHIPTLPVKEESSKRILARTMEMDWRTQPAGQPFLQTFTAVPRWKVNNELFAVAERLGVDRVAARLVRGFF